MESALACQAPATGLAARQPPLHPAQCETIEAAAASTTATGAAPPPTAPDQSTPAGSSGPTPGQPDGAVDNANAD
ncbi:MAG TPA: hypothetical protein VIX89_08080, partial [Bryobacteraceae bacterium]